MNNIEQYKNGINKYLDSVLKDSYLIISNRKNEYIGLDFTFRVFVVKSPRPSINDSTITHDLLLYFSNFHEGQESLIAMQPNIMKNIQDLFTITVHGHVGIRNMVYDLTYPKIQTTLSKIGIDFYDKTPNYDNPFIGNYCDIDFLGLDYQIVTTQETPKIKFL